MNILFLTPYPPVLHMHGGGVRMFHNIRILSERHRVRVISFVENEDDRRSLRALEPFCESVTGIDRVPDFRPHWFSLKPFLMREFSTDGMFAAVEKAYREWGVDLVQCEYLQMAHYARPGTFSILTEHEAVSANAFQAFRQTADVVERFKLFYRWMALLNYEVEMCKRFDRVVTMTEEDARYLRSYARNAHIRAIPIGIDSNYFKPVFAAPSAAVEVVFVGNFRHTPNVEAAEFLLQEVVPHFNGLRFVIAGSHLPEKLRKADGVHFPGYVPDTRALFHAPDTIFAAPLFSGTGQRVKLLEAFAMQCPVITTSVGTFGFPIQNGEQALIANTPDEFRDALTALLSSTELRMRLGESARRMIVERFDWATLSPLFTHLVEDRE